MGMALCGRRCHGSPVNEALVQEFVEVAIPVPLRTLFTYRVPEELKGKLFRGSRIAVPFGRRKVAGFVVGGRDAAPEGVKRVVKVAGLLEEHPVFPEELLSFLEKAAAYYLHPLGEVLRAAAPALPAGAMRRLRKDGFLEGDENLKGRTVGRRKELVAKATGTKPEGRLGLRQQAILALVEERGEIGSDELRQRHPGARTVLKALEKRGLVSLEEREVFRDPFFGKHIARDAAPELNPAQRHAVDTMVQALPQGGAFLLHGVTGSGKTEVYLHVIDEARKSGRGGLLLVPEIALTPQLVGRFRARFGDDIAVLHSGLGEKERDDAWRRLRRGELRLAVGARSALFAPVPELGVLVVDEEHDPSFKQEEGFRYSARDMAILRAHRAGAVCVLGSATPSLESFALTERGQATLLSLPERATSQKLPEVEIVDLRIHRHGPTGNPLISGPLHFAIADCLEKGHQGILFLNRRGFAPSVRCLACGAAMECPSCSVPLTEHRRARQLRCHYCDYARPQVERCPECGAAEMKPLGLGTEQLEAALAEAFPTARVARLDRDVASGKGVETVLNRLRRGEIDLLVGTQMVTKGHDVPTVTLVGVVLADQSLGFPDFRAGERTFQLLAQVAGRAGRGEAEGKVYFQSYNPDHPAIVAAAKHDYDAFRRAEAAQREELAYPPYGRMVAVRLNGVEDHHVRNAADILAALARRHPGAEEGRVILQGPAPAPIARLRNRYRYRFLVRSDDRRALRQIAHAMARRIDEGLGHGVRATVDVDPVSML